MQHQLIEDFLSLQTLCQQYSKANVLAIDTEFVRTRTLYPRLGLLQVFDGEQEIKLSPKEFSVLNELIIHRGRVLSKDQLTDLIYGWSEDLDSNAIEVHVHHLRKKLSTGVIETIRGVGYKIT